MTQIGFSYNDGGRQLAGFKSHGSRTSDCGTRSFAIVAGRPYREVYDEIAALGASEKPMKPRNGRPVLPSHPNTGIFTRTMKTLMAAHGWIWVPTMGIGTGCTVHMRASELPAGALLICLSRHFTAVIDGVEQSTYDSSRAGMRCVYGYWRKP